MTAHALTLAAGTGPMVARTRGVVDRSLGVTVVAAWFRGAARQVQSWRHLSTCDGVGVATSAGFSDLRKKEGRSGCGECHDRGWTIDRAFVAGLGVNASDTAIVRSVIALANELGLAVIAEGIETEAQLDELVSFGCPRGQGYVLGRPVPPQDLILPAGSAWRGRPSSRAGRHAGEVLRDLTTRSVRFATKLERAELAVA